MPGKQTGKTAILTLLEVPAEPAPAIVVIHNIPVIYSDGEGLMPGGVQAYFCAIEDLGTNAAYLWMNTTMQPVKISGSLDWGALHLGDGI